MVVPTWILFVPSFETSHYAFADRVRSQARMVQPLDPQDLWACCYHSNALTLDDVTFASRVEGLLGTMISCRIRTGKSTLKWVLEKLAKPYEPGVSQMPCDHVQIISWRGWAAPKVVSNPQHQPPPLMRGKGKHAVRRRPPLKKEMYSGCICKC